MPSRELWLGKDRGSIIALIVAILRMKIETRYKIMYSLSLTVTVRPSIATARTTVIRSMIHLPLAESHRKQMLHRKSNR